MLSGKVKKTKTGKDSGKSSEKSSKKDKASSKGSRKKAKVDTRPTFIGIPEEMILEILKQRISLFRTGVVIESLLSIFLKQPLLALTTVLKAIGNVQYISCIILSHTYEENRIYKENLKKLEEKRAIEEREALLRKACETDLDVSELTPEQHEAIREFVLKERKLKTLAKREALK